MRSPPTSVRLLVEYIYKIRVWQVNGGNSRKRSQRHRRFDFCPIATCPFSLFSHHILLFLVLAFAAAFIVPIYSTSIRTLSLPCLAIAGLVISFIGTKNTVPGKDAVSNKKGVRGVHGVESQQLQKYGVYGVNHSLSCSSVKRRCVRCDRYRDCGDCLLLV